MISIRTRALMTLCLSALALMVGLPGASASELSPQEREDRLDRTQWARLMEAEGFTPVRMLPAGFNQSAVEVGVNGRTLRLVVDTGASYTTITPGATANAGLRPIPGHWRSFSGIGGSYAAAQVQPAQFEFPGVAANSGTVYVARPAPVGSDGMVGLDTLRANHAILQVNPPLLFINPAHGVSPALGAWLRQKGSTVVALDLSRRGYSMPVRLNGLAAGMVVDTGANLSLLSADFVLRNHLPRQPLGLRMRGADGGMLNGDGVHLAAVELGGLPIGEKIMPFADVALFRATKDLPASDGLLGFDLLASIRTVIDTAADTAYLRLPSP